MQERGGKERESSGLKRGDTGEKKGSLDRGETGGKSGNDRKKIGERLGAVPADLQAWALKATVTTAQSRYY